MSYPKKEIDEFVFTKFQTVMLDNIDNLKNLCRQIKKSPIPTLDQVPMTVKVREYIDRYTKLLLIDAAKGNNKNK